MASQYFIIQTEHFTLRGRVFKSKMEGRAFIFQAPLWKQLPVWIGETDTLSFRINVETFLLDKTYSYDWTLNYPSVTLQWLLGVFLLYSCYYSHMFTQHSALKHQLFARFPSVFFCPASYPSPTLSLVLPLKREFFFPAISKCKPTGGHLIVGAFLSLSYDKVP